jgi:hypothetical protein
VQKIFYESRYLESLVMIILIYTILVFFLLLVSLVQTFNDSETEVEIKNDEPENRRQIFSLSLICSDIIWSGDASSTESSKIVCVHTQGIQTTKTILLL